jgi:hypothetical protein
LHEGRKQPHAQEAFRALLRERGHSSFSAAPLIGASAAQIRNWTSGRRPIPEKYLAAIERLPERVAGDARWSPAELPGVSQTCPRLRSGDRQPAAPVPKRRRSRTERRAARPVVEVDPADYDKRHPTRAVDLDPDEPTAPIGGILGAIAGAFARFAPGPVLEGYPVGCARGQSFTACYQLQLPAVIPRYEPSKREGEQALPLLPPGTSLPRPAMIFDSVFSATLRGKACCSPLMVRHAGGMVAPAFCGQTSEPGSDVCSAHLPPAAASPQLQTATAAPIKIKARRPVYY